MSNIKELLPKSLSEYIDTLDKLRNDTDNHLWFRGIEKKSFKLIPSLYRHKEIITLDRLSALEKGLMSRFKQRSMPYITQNLENDWDTMFFMQHHFIPTRLLDWTENPLTALHFALINATDNQPEAISSNKRENAIVWILDPRKWNEHALSDLSYVGGPLDVGDENLQGYKPKQDFLNLLRFPVAIFGAHNSPRIVAQQGVFTIFGKILKPMEYIHHKYAFPEDSLIKIIIKSNVMAKIRESLLRIGITESVVFPDLVGLAMEIKRYFGF